jgi:hypothetical protein
MPKAEIELTNGTKISIDGSKEDIAELLSLYEAPKKQKPEKGSHKSKKKRPTTNKKTSRDQLQESTIKLSENNLRNIQRYFKNTEYKNGRILVFAICNFLSEAISKEEIRSGDVIQIYESMIPLGIKVTKLQHIHQTMVDLSSKRKWLENKGGGIFTISRIGKIKWQEMKSEKQT